MHPKPAAPALLVWWILWFAILMGLVIIYTVVSPGISGKPDGPVRYLPALAVAASSFVRWILIPKETDATKALSLFLIGLALAEGCGILGIFLVPDLKQTYFLLAVIGIAQFAPFFAKRFEPKR